MRLPIPTRTPGLRRPLLRIIALSAIVGVVCAAFNVGVIGPKRHDGVATAVGHVVVDTPGQSIVQRQALQQDLQTLVKHTELLGRVLISPPVLDRIAARLHVAPNAVGGAARSTAAVPQTLNEPDSERRANDIATARRPLLLEVQAQPTTPILDIYAQAPTPAQATALVNAAVPALHEFLAQLALEQGFPLDKIAALRPIGVPTGAVVSHSAPKVIFLMTFLTGFGLAFALLMGLSRWRAARRPAPLEIGQPAPSLAAPTDDWPHTARVLPWMLAGFMALIWFVPIDSVELAVSTPIDMKLDRLTLPFIAVVWLLALVAGGRLAPRMRMTRIHGAIAAFVACAFLSVVLNAHDLTHIMELELAIKKLPLLVTYVGFFVIVASGVRATEVSAFLRYTLVLAVICSIGMLYESRTHVNVFHLWTSRILPHGIFEFGDDGSGAPDSIGRPQVVGPASVGVEAVSMLSMALPIGLVGLMQSQTWRSRLRYGFATCVIVAATFATYRKSGLLAPVSVVVMLAYFRRRELLRLAPLGALLMVVVTVAAPGAMGSTLSQFVRSDRATVGTVSDRAADYDAVRPDFWTHLAFGRGWGTYNHQTYRILDSELLHQVVELGIFGLLAFVVIMASVVSAARPIIAGRDPRWAPQALIGAAAAVCFLVTSGLYDQLSFPHATYMFLYMAGLVAAVVARGPDQPRPATGAPTPRRVILDPPPAPPPGAGQDPDRVPVGAGVA